MEQQVRLNKHLKDLGICSRRQADEFIAQGYVTVNDNIITNMGYKINPLTDKVVVLPIVSRVISQFRYILLNKPIGYVCTKSLVDGKNIFKLLPSINNLTYAGRLDKDSHGLIVLSNDGKFVYQVCASEFAQEKEYLVRVDKPVTENFLYRQSNGSIRLDGRLVKKARVEAVNPYTYKIVLTEGINRQIRKMAQNQGYHVVDLKRIRIGKVTDVNLRTGEWRELSPSEIKLLSYSAVSEQKIK